MNRIRNAVGFSTVGRKVLGPRPGLAVVSFWQGIVEIALRVATVVSVYDKCNAAILELFCASF